MEGEKREEQKHKTTPSIIVLEYKLGRVRLFFYLSLYLHCVSSLIDAPAARIPCRFT
jgi:hypothetical protein